MRWNVLWLETRLDCRVWAYYCDLRKAMARLHALSTIPSHVPPTGPDLIVVGPRFATNNYHVWDALGISRRRWSFTPLVVVQNKMFDCVRGESCGGGADVKLEWARQVGAAAAFTWLTRHHEFTARSGVKHHWMPFAADPEIYGQQAGKFDSQEFDVGFSGTLDPVKYPLRSEVVSALQGFVGRFGWKASVGSWSKTNTMGNWTRFNRQEYARRIAATKIWLSTTGPDWIVGTRYFEVLATGTTLLMCNRPTQLPVVGPGGGPWVYEGLFRDGVHMVTFATMPELEEKLQYYLTHEAERRRIVRAAHEMATREHSWDARARFISAVARKAIDAHPVGVPWYVPPPAKNSSNHYEGCYTEVRSRPAESSNATAQQASGAWHEQSQPPHLGPFSSGFNVSDCEQRCARRPWSHFALTCGGFCKSGDVHNRGRCLCGSMEAWLLARAAPVRNPAVCDSTCSLHDDRPCGAAGAMAVYRLVSARRR